MINVNVKYFAAIRDIAGKDEERRSLPPRSSIASFIELLVSEYPNMGGWKDSLRVAVNQEYVKNEYQLNDGDEVAVIPPVSGG